MLSLNTRQSVRSKKYFQITEISILQQRINRKWMNSEHFVLISRTTFSHYFLRKCFVINSIDVVHNTFLLFIIYYELTLIMFCDHGQSQLYQTRTCSTWSLITACWQAKWSCWWIALLTMVVDCFQVLSFHTWNCLVNYIYIIKCD